MPFDLNRSVASARALRRVVGGAEYEPGLLHEFNHIEFIEEFLSSSDEIYSHLRKLGSMCSPNAESSCHAFPIGNRIIYIIFLLESRKSILYACYARTSSYLSKEQYSDHVRQNTVFSGVSRGCANILGILNRCRGFSKKKRATRILLSWIALMQSNMIMTYNDSPFTVIVVFAPL